MKKIVFICFTVLSMNTLISCDNSKDTIDTELTIQEKVALLENSQWLLKNFEDRVMYEFKAGERLTFYGENTIFTEPIPGTNDYSVKDNLLFIDFNFGNNGTYDLKFSCNNSIVEFYEDGELNSTLFQLGSNYEECLN